MPSKLYNSLTNPRIAKCNQHEDETGNQRSEQPSTNTHQRQHSQARQHRARETEETRVSDCLHQIAPLEAQNRTEVDRNRARRLKSWRCSPLVTPDLAQTRDAAAHPSCDPAMSWLRKSPLESWAWHCIQLTGTGVCPQFAHAESTSFHAKRTSFSHEDKFGILLS